MDLFKLVGSVFIDTDDANDSLSKTDKKAQSTGETFKKVAGTAAKVGTAVVGAAGAAVGGMISMAKSTASTADTVDKASQRMGIGAESYQELAYAAELSGVEMSTLEKAAKSLEGMDMNLDDALNEIYALEDAEDRAKLAAELFGNSVAYQMTPMLNASGPEIAAMREEANQLGLVMDEASVSAGATLNDAITKVTESFTALGTNLGATLMPLVTELMEFIIEQMPTIQGLFDTLAPVLFDMFKQIVPPIMQLAKQLLPVVVQLITTVLPPLTQIVMAVLPLITGFFETFMPVFVQLAQAVLPVVLSLIKAVLPVIQMIANVIRTGIGAAIKFVLPLIQKVGTFFTSVFDNIKNVAKSVLNSLIGFINGLINGLNIFLTPFRAIIAGIGSMIGKGTSLKDVSLPTLPYLAKGGELSSGAAIVGEDGPELLTSNGSRTRVTPLNDNNNAFASVEAKLDTLIALLTKGFGVTIDGRKLVGYLLPDVNRGLGQLTASEGRVFA